MYTETVVHSAPEQYAAEAPYQIAIIDVEGNARQTVRIIAGDAQSRVRIGDRVIFVEYRDGVAYYQRAWPERDNSRSQASISNESAR